MDVAMIITGLIMLLGLTIGAFLRGGTIMPKTKDCNSLTCNWALMPSAMAVKANINTSLFVTAI